MTNRSKRAISTGDLIKVTHVSDAGDVDLIIRGTAMTNLDMAGDAWFEVRIPGSEQIVQLNCNYVNVDLVFAADIARKVTS